MKPSSAYSLTLLFVVGILFIPLAEATTQEDLLADMQSYWTMDNSSVSGSTLSDDYGSVNGGIVGGVTAGDGFEGDSRHFDGSTGRIDLNDSYDATTDGFAYSFWFKADTCGAWEGIINKMDLGASPEAGGYGYTVGSDCSVLAQVMDDQNVKFLRKSGGSPRSVDTWYHVVMGYDGGSTNESFNVWVNAVPDTVATSDTSFTTPRDNSIDLNFGRLTSSGSPFWYDGQLDEVSYYNRTLTDTEIDWLYNSGSGRFLDDINPPAPPATPSNHSTETLTQTEQETNVTLNSVAYTTIHSYSFTPTFNDTNFYQTYTIPVDPTASNTLTCRVQVDGTTLGGEHSRTNTIDQVGNLLIKSTNTTLDTTSHTVDLQCRRTGGGAMELFNIIGAGHELKDSNDGSDIYYEQYTFTNTTSTGTLVTIENQTHTTNISSLEGSVQQHIIVEYTGTITNNAGAGEDLRYQAFIGSTDCIEYTRYVNPGGSGSIGGTCTRKDVTNNTNYDIGFRASGTNAEYDFTWDVREIYVDDEGINNTQVNFTKAAETSWTKIDEIDVEQDIANGNDIYTFAGLNANGTGDNVEYQLRLSGDSDVNATRTWRYTSSDFGVLGIHNVFPSLNTGNYTIELWADVTNLDTLYADLIGYEVQNQALTENNFLFNATNQYNGSALDVFTVTDDAGNSYGTNNGDLYISKQGLLNITFSATGYNDVSYQNVNTSTTSYTGNLCEIYLRGLEGTDLEGRTITHPYNLTLNGSTYVITDTSTYACAALSKTDNITWAKDSWYSTTAEHTYTPVGIHNYTPTNKANSYFTFSGATSGTEYYPTCSANGTSVTRNSNYYAMLDNGMFECIESLYYAAFNWSIGDSFTTNQTYNITEYTVVLQFDQNTTGSVKWSLPNEAGECCQFPLDDPNGYNTTSFQFIKVQHAFANGDHVFVRFNNQSNLSQNYEWVNTQGTIVNESIKVLDVLDQALWVTVYNYANEELYGATVRVEHCPNATATDCEVVQQRITQSQGGTAVPGALIGLDDSLDYWITVSGAGYTTQNIIVNAEDLENNNVWQVKLQPTPYTATTQYILNCPQEHVNASFIYCSLSGPTNKTIRYNTTANSVLQTVNLGNGGAGIRLVNGTDYLEGQNMNLYIQELQDDGTWLEMIRFTTTYVPYANYDLYISEGETNDFASAMLWITLILVAGIAGRAIRKDEIDTGYYAFGIFAIALGIFYPTFLYVAAIIILTGVGSLLFSTTRE